MYTSCLLGPDARLGSASTTNGLRPAHVICSTIREIERLRKSHLPPAFVIFRISTGCLSASMERHPVTFVALWLRILLKRSAYDKIIVGMPARVPFTL